MAAAKEDSLKRQDRLQVPREFGKELWERGAAVVWQQQSAQRHVQPVYVTLAARAVHVIQHNQVNIR